MCYWRLYYFLFLCERDLFGAAGRSGTMSQQWLHVIRVDRIFRIWPFRNNFTEMKVTYQLNWWGKQFHVGSVTLECAPGMPITSGNANSRLLCAQSWRLWGTLPSWQFWDKFGNQADNRIALPVSLVKNRNPILNVHILYYMSVADDGRSCLESQPCHQHDPSFFEQMSTS